MGKQCFLAAGSLLAAYLVVSTSALFIRPLKNPTWSSSAADASSGQGGSKRDLGSVNSVAVWATEAPASPAWAGRLPSEASKDHKLRILSLILNPISNKLVLLGTPGASGRATSVPATTAHARTKAHRTPGSQPASSVEAHRTLGSQPVSSVKTHWTPRSQPASSVGTHRTPGSQPASSVGTQRTPRSQPASSVETHRTPRSQPASSVKTHWTPGSQPAPSVEAYRIPESQPASSVEAHRTPKSQPSFFVETLGTPSSQPVSPVEAHGTPKSQPVSSVRASRTSSSQPVSSVEAHGSPESQPVSSVEAHGSPESQPVSSVEAHGSPESQPVSSVEAHGTPESQPVSSVEAHGSPRSQPVSSVEAHGSPRSQPVSSVEAHGSPESQPASSMEAHGSPGSQPASSVAGPGPSGVLTPTFPSTAPSSDMSSLSSPSLPLSLPPLSSPSPAPHPSLPSSLLSPLTPASSFSSHIPFPPLSLPRLSPPSSLMSSLTSAPSSSSSPSSPSLLRFPSPSLWPPQSPSAPPSQGLITEPAASQGTVQARPVLPPRPVPTAVILSLASAPANASSLWEPKSSILRGAGPGQAISPQVSASSSPGPHHVFHSLDFRITGEAFSAALMDPTSRKYQLLSKKVRDQLEPVYHNAFPSFEGVEALVLRSSSVRRSKSVAVAASLVFGGQSPSPTSCQVLWTLYCKVKASRQMLGTLSVAEGSLASDGLNMTHLALETIRIHFTVMRPFLSQLSEPDSTPFVQLEEQTLQQVTPVVEKFYKVHPQERPLLLFSNVDQWVDVHIEYKFPAPVPTHNQGLADYLAQNVLDPTLQISSLMANGEKAQLVLYELRLQILDQPFTKALKDKASAESQQLRERLTRGLTAALRHLQNMSQVVVEEFQLDPLTARVGATFFRAAPAEALVHDCVRQGLLSLREAEGLSVKLVVPDLVTPSSGVSAQPSTSIPIYIVALLVLNLLFFILALILVLKRRACCRVFCPGRLRPPSQRSAP